MSEISSYHLYLSSFTNAPYLTNRSDLASVKYNINWDSFFNQDNYRYKRCRIFYKFLSDPCSSATYNYDPLGFSGIILANGLAPISNQNFGGLMLGMIDVKSVTYLSNAVSTNTTVLYSEDFNNGTGQQIQMPIGFRELNIQLWANNFAASGAGLLSSVSANIPLNNWNLLLKFELYDPVEEM